MGTLDEHWCSICKRRLDKKIDVYVEFEIVDAKKKKKFPIKLRKKKLKGNICSDCIEKNPELKKAIELVIKAGNPLFKPKLICGDVDECGDFEPSKTEGVNCGRICVITDKIYCNRSHVGSLKLPREKAEVRREEGQIMVKMLERYVKDPKVMELMKTTLLKTDLLKGVYIPPSAIVEDKGEVKADQT
ncbi:hypothetical protein ES702_00465 [subsurface metagenome]